MKLHHVGIFLVLLCCLSVCVFGLVRLWTAKRTPGPYAEAPVIRAPAPSQKNTDSLKEHTPVTVPKFVAKAPAPGALRNVPRQDDIVRDLAGVLVAAYQPADACAPGNRPGVLRLNARELVRRYEPALADRPDLFPQLSVTPPMLEIGYLFMSGRFVEEVRTQVRKADRLCPSNGSKRPLTSYEAEEALVLIAAWLRQLAACTREARHSQDCDYARQLAEHLLEGESARSRVVAAAGKLLDRLAQKIDGDIEKKGG